MQLVKTKNYECPRCGFKRIWKQLVLKQDNEIDDNKACCGECGFESIADHFKKTAELNWHKRQKEVAENQTIGRIWFLIKNAKRYGYYMDGVGSMDDGKYLDRDEILALMETFLFFSDGEQSAKNV